MTNDTRTSDLLSRLKEQADVRYDNPHGKFVTVTANVMAALIDCAEIVRTDYLLLSPDQQMKALKALKELGL